MTETLTNTPFTTTSTNKETSTMRINPTTMPPSITNKQIATAAAELTRLATEASRAREEAHALEVARPEVEAADRAALGRALPWALVAAALEADAAPPAPIRPASAA